jgi:putative DNA methylase
MTRRLIETWLPIAALGIESLRERTADDGHFLHLTVHVWWARRPLVASRAAVLASLLPEDADHGKFLHMLGIHGDVAASRRRMNAARRKGERFEGQAYSYSRAFTYAPSDTEELQWLEAETGVGTRPACSPDPTAGGGADSFRVSPPWV